jgi:hypothetical protein
MVCLFLVHCKILMVHSLSYLACGWALFAVGVIQIPFWGIWAICKYYKTSIPEVIVSQNYYRVCLVTIKIHSRQSRRRSGRPKDGVPRVQKLIKSGNCTKRRMRGRRAEIPFQQDSSTLSSGSGGEDPILLQVAIKCRLPCKMHIPSSFA